MSTSPNLKRRLEEPEDVKPIIRPRLSGPERLQFGFAGTGHPRAQRPVPPPDNNQTQAGADNDLQFPAQRYEEFYYDDGNVILVTQDTPDGSHAAVFRVFKSQLQRQSAILKVLIDDAVAGGEMIDGLPAVRLDDSTGDIANFFKALLGPPIQDPSYELLVSALLVSSKYDVEAIRTWSVKCLSRKIPVTWEMFLKEPTLTTLDFYIAPSRLLKLAKELKLPEFYGIAAYKLSTISWADQSPQVRKHMLDGVSWEIIVVGREELVRRSLEYLYKDPTVGQKGCPFHLMGYNGLQQCHLPFDLGLWAYSTNESLTNDPLGWVAGRLEAAYDQHCRQCKEKLIQSLREFGKDMFKDLPEIFEMPGLPADD